MYLKTLPVKTSCCFTIIRCTFAINPSQVFNCRFLNATYLPAKVNEIVCAKSSHRPPLSENVLPGAGHKHSRNPYLQVPLRAECPPADWLPGNPDHATPRFAHSIGRAARRHHVGYRRMPLEVTQCHRDKTSEHAKMAPWARPSFALSRPCKWRCRLATALPVTITKVGTIIFSTSRWVFRYYVLSKFEYSSVIGFKPL